MLLFFILACCIAGVFGNVIEKKKKTAIANRAKIVTARRTALLRLPEQRSKVRTVDGAAVVLRRSMSVLDGFRLVSRQINVKSSPPLKYLQQ